MFEEKGNKNEFCLDMLLLISLQDILNKCPVGHGSGAQRRCGLETVRSVLSTCEYKPWEWMRPRRKQELLQGAAVLVCGEGGVSKGERADS